MSETNSIGRLVERLAALETGLISDVLDEAGLPDQVVSATLTPILAGQKVCGPAACVRGAPIVNRNRESPALPAEALEGAVSPGSVLVIETRQFTLASCIGGLTALSLKNHGCTGIVMDGSVRDIDEIAELGMPCFAAGRSPINAARRWRFVEAGAPVMLPGQTGSPILVSPGDLILGDADGIVVLPVRHAEQIIEDAEKLQAIEANIVIELQGGGQRAEVFQRNPRFSHVRSLKDK